MSQPRYLFRLHSRTPTETRILAWRYNAEARARGLLYRVLAEGGDGPEDETEYPVAALTESLRLYAAWTGRLPHP